MPESMRATVLLGAACLFAAGSSAWGQQSPSAGTHKPASADLAVTYTAERAYVAPGSCDCFWLQGGGADVAISLWKGIGVAAALTGGHASNITPGVNLSKVTYMAGPRYTYTPAHSPTRLHAQVFGEALFGGAHAFDSTFPSSAELNSSANSFALQTGGGFQVYVSQRFAIRAFQLEYVRTALPNHFSNTQNDLQVAFGVSYHLVALAHSR